MSILSLRHVHLSFGKKDVLRKVSLDLEPYERVELVGRNGRKESFLFHQPSFNINLFKG